MSEINKREYDIKIGISNNKNENEGAASITLCEEARNGVTMFLGMSGSGKSQYIIPTLFKQDIEKGDRGITIICNQKDIAYTLYAMAKEYRKRKVILIKPSTNFNLLNNLLLTEDWDYDYIDQNIINYKKAIKDKAIVIIDMEYDFYRNDATRATAMLLLQLQTDMCLTSQTNKTKHSVYIDDCQNFLPFIEMILKCGSSYNIITNLFFQGRNQFICRGVDYTPVIENNTKNTFLMNNLNYEDTKYYSERFSPLLGGDKNKLLTKLYSLPYGNFSYEIQDENNRRKVGLGVLIGLKEDETQRIKKKAIKARKKLTKVGSTTINLTLLQEEINILHQMRINAYVEDSKEKEENKPQQVQENIQENSKTKSAESIKEDFKEEESKEELLKEEVPISQEKSKDNLDKSLNESESLNEDIVQSNEPQINNEQDELDKMLNDALDMNDNESKDELDDLLNDFDALGLNDNLNDIDNDLLNDTDLNIDDTLSDDLDSMFNQIENDDISGSPDDVLPNAMKSDDEFELDGEMEVANIVKNSVRNKYIFFPNMTGSLQKQYNKELRKIG